eukprot:g16971.t1
MLAICFEAERFSVDALYEKLLSWFGRRSFYVVGELNFADAFYHLQHYEHRATEEHSRNVLVQTIASDMVSSRDQFRAVTRDSRWCSLPVYFVETILNYDKLPIVSETEILSLIERWNATADKDKSDIVRLLACFRPSEDSKMAMKNWLCLMGWVDDSGNVVSIPGLEGLEKIISGKATKGKKPRNCKSADVDVRDYTKAMLENYHSDLQPEGNEDEIDATFFHYHGSKVLAQGCSFNLGAGDRLLQADVLRDSGISRLRVALSEPSSLLWNPEHEVFVGLSYGEGKYFGFLCSASAFSGIFSVRALASAAPAPSAPVHLTGSGNKMEFDLGLEIQLHRVDLVVTCELSCIFKNEYLTKERFQISHDTLVNGPGLRYQLVGTGLEKSRVLVNLAWVSGGGPSNDKHVDYGPIGFVEAHSHLGKQVEWANERNKGKGKGGKEGKAPVMEDWGSAWMGNWGHGHRHGGGGEWHPAGQRGWENGRHRGGQLFVGNLPADTDEDALTFVFGKYGPLDKVHVICGRSKNYRSCAYVEFQNIEAADMALQTLHQKYRFRQGEQPIYIDWANDGRRPAPY